MIRALLCKLPKWAGGRHRWGRAYVPDETAPAVREKRCRRCETTKTMRPYVSRKTGGER